MVGHAHPIERRLDLDIVAEGMLDRLPLGVGVGVGRTGKRVPENVSIERPACVDVGLAEVGVAIGIVLCRGRERAGNQCREGGKRKSMSEESFPHLSLRNVMKQAHEPVVLVP